MGMTDPIADMLTRLRNANSVLHDKVEIPGSKIKQAIAEVLKEEGFIKDFSFAEDNKQGVITINLKYGPNREQVSLGLNVFLNLVFVLMLRKINYLAYLVVLVLLSSLLLKVL